MKKVLIMGGSYFIGKAITDTFLNAEYDVTVLNRGTKKHESEKVHQLECDRNSANDMKRILSEFHFDIIVDVSGLNKLQAAILCQSFNTPLPSAFIFISSSAVYDVEHLEITYCECDAIAENRFWRDYGTNKIEAENYLTQSFIQTNTSLIILRPTYVYGENNYAQRESFIFEHIVNDKPVLIPKSNNKLQFIYAPVRTRFSGNYYKPSFKTA